MELSGPYDLPEQALESVQRHAHGSRRNPKLDRYLGSWQVLDIAEPEQLPLSSLEAFDDPEELAPLLSSCDEAARASLPIDRPRARQGPHVPSQLPAPVLDPLPDHGLKERSQRLSLQVLRWSLDQAEHRLVGEVLGVGTGTQLVGSGHSPLPMTASEEVRGFGLAPAHPRQELCVRRYHG